MWRIDLFEKTPILGKIEGRRRRGHRGCDGWVASPTQWIWVWVNSGSWWWTGKPGVLQSMGLQRVGHGRAELYLLVILYHSWFLMVLFQVSRNLLKLMSIESVMLSNHLILCHPLLLPSIFPSIRVFSNESTLPMRWPKHWSFSFSSSPSN